MDGSASTRHSWSFFRAGGFDQVKLETGADLCALAELDQKLWAALSCPTRGLHYDEKTLDLMDSDKDGRIRVPEMIEATRWACSLIKNPDELVEHAAALPLASINDAAPEGKQILSSARQILANLGKPEAGSISIDDTTDTQRIFAQTRFNGDGIIPADAAADAATQSVIADIIALYGATPDRSGKPGVDSARCEAFFKDLQAYSDWWAASEPRAEEIFPLGDATAAAYAAYDMVDAKIDDYFARCQLAAYDQRAQAALNRQETEYLAIAAKDLSLTSDEIISFPLARVAADKPLPLLKELNPAWTSRMLAFVQQVVTPLLGNLNDLTEADWLAIKRRLAAYAAWQAVKQGAAVEKLTLARVREILASGAKEAIAQLIVQDKALEPEVNAIAQVDRLVRYYGDLHLLLTNFVNFRDFYDRGEPAIFQAGTLYLDQRSCSLCVQVADMSKHASLAPLSRVYLAYCDCVRKSGTEKLSIVAAFTSGDSDNLMIGRNGVFYDRKGTDWDATIVKIFENPISISQAFWSPYKRVIRWVEETIAKKAAAADTAATDTLTSAAGNAMQSAVAGKPPAPAKPRIDIGTVAALGVAVGGITAALGAFLQAFFGLGMLMPLGLVGLILLISGPSMIIAWLKLRQRNLGPILDANGWAVNTRAKINIPFGTTLTGVPKLPPGSRRDLRDPYAESNQARNSTILIVTILATVWALWYFGAIEAYAPGVTPKSGYLERLEKKAEPAKAPVPTTPKVEAK